MKIALFSDIHSNLPALEAFFKDVENHQPDVLYCLAFCYKAWQSSFLNPFVFLQIH
jgi:hypothetical protein